MTSPQHFKLVTLGISTSVLLVFLALTQSCATGTDTITGQTEEAAAITLTAKPYPCTPGNTDYSCTQIKEFAELDKNGDRFISTTREIKNTKSRLAKADFNEDKKLSIIEFMNSLDAANNASRKERVCVHNSGKKAVNWEIVDTRINARDDGFVATMGQHLSRANGSGYICAEVADREGPYVFRAEIDGAYCMIKNLTGNTMVNIQNKGAGIQCTPQRDGFHGTAAVAKEFPVEYARMNKRQSVSGFPFREISLRNNSSTSSFTVTLKNPQGKNFTVQFGPLSGYRFDLNTRVDEFYKPIEVQIQEANLTEGAARPESRSVFPIEKNLQCELNRNGTWKYQQYCRGVLVGSYGFVSDITVW